MQISIIENGHSQISGWSHSGYAHLNLYTIIYSFNYWLYTMQFNGFARVLPKWGTGSDRRMVVLVRDREGVKLR